MGRSAAVRLNHRYLYVLLLCFVTQANTSARVAKSSTALRCGVDPEQPASRIFADPDGKHGWREYRNVKDVPELELGMGQFARLWTETHGMALVRLEEPGDDFGVYTDYCFDKDGQLVALKFSLRTAWGWGYREEGPVTNGELTPQMSEFFDTSSEAPIKRPEQADDIPDALKPSLYVRKSRLPFAKLLPK
jgi:hypothetical protein